MAIVAASADSPLPNSEIELWFEFGSNYSYLSVMRIEALASRARLSILWRPFLLGPIFKSFGWETSPFVLQAAKGAYVWKDMQRQCHKYGLAWTRPSVFPRPALLPARVALLGATRPWIGEFCRQVMLQNFAADRDIDTAQSVGDILAALELPAEEIIREAQAAPNKLRLREQTETAARRGVFGAPIFFVRDEMFWGNDRLEDAVAFAAAEVRHKEPT
jgi:2-hydroxychromene-2-carboxylate isomerase